MEPKIKPELLKEASSHLRKLAQVSVAAEKRAGDAEHELYAYKLAHRMEQRQMHQELSFDEKLATLLRHDTTKLADLERALELAAGGFRLGAVAEEDKIANAGTGTQDVLDAFVTSQQAFT